MHAPCRRLLVINVRPLLTFDLVGIYTRGQKLSVACIVSARVHRPGCGAHGDRVICIVVARRLGHGGVQWLDQLGRLSCGRYQGFSVDMQAKQPASLRCAHFHMQCWISDRRLLLLPALQKGLRMEWDDTSVKDMTIACL
jgi:hypothetical protein